MHAWLDCPEKRWGDFVQQGGEGRGGPSWGVGTIDANDNDFVVVMMRYEAKSKVL